jgi:acetyltransferase
MASLRELSPEEVLAHQAALADLLWDTVDSGASVGFLPPLARNEAIEYWDGVASALRAGGRILAVAEMDNRIVGAVQLALELRANGNHRAEVMKLMVHRHARGQGIGRELMHRIESLARENGRTLIVLDTRSGCGDAAEQLYYKLGYQKAGVIPGYARSASGNLDDTVFLYRRLD